MAGEAMPGRLMRGDRVRAKNDWSAPDGSGERIVAGDEVSTRILVGVRRTFHLSLLLTASRMVSPKILVLDAPSLLVRDWHKSSYNAATHKSLGLGTRRGDGPAPARGGGVLGTTRATRHMRASHLLSLVENHVFTPALGAPGARHFRAAHTRSASVRI